MAVSKRTSRPRVRRVDPAAVIETPVRGVFLSGKGDLLTTLPADVNVQPIATLRNTTFDLNVGGIGFANLKEAQTTGNGGNVGISVKVASGLEVTAAALAVFSGAVKAVEATVTLLQWMGLIPEPSPFQELYAAVVTELKIALKKTLGGFTSLTMQNIAQVSGHATTAAGIAYDALSGRKMTPGILAEADYYSRYAVTTLADEAYWKRTFDEDALGLWPGIWSSLTRAPQPDAENLVWDYRLTLLAYMRVIMARIAVISVIDPEFQTTGSHHREIMGYVAQLRALEMRIRGGLAKFIVKPPESNWHLVAAACGVVDIHSGVTDSTQSWHPSSAFSDPLDVLAMGGIYPTTWPQYQRMFDNATELRFWRLYDALGLFKFWTIIPDLEALAGPPRRRLGLADQAAFRVKLFELLPPTNTKKWKSQMDWIEKNKAMLMEDIAVRHRASG